MVKPFPSKTHIGNHMLHPETLMLNYGYDPQLSEGAVKPPVFLTSTFVFKTAELRLQFGAKSAQAARPTVAASDDGGVHQQLFPADRDVERRRLVGLGLGRWRS